MAYSLHPKWQGVWEIRGHSRWNGERMIIIFYDNECVLTECTSLEEYTLTADPQSNLKAHWDFRSSGKAQRYYIGTLSHSKTYDFIEWNEMRKKRKTDNWIRIDTDPITYLQQCKSKKPHKYTNTNTNKRRNKPPKKAHKAINNHTQTLYIRSNNEKYVRKQKYANNQNPPPINDPAIMDMIHYNGSSHKSHKYQTEHKPHKNNEFYVECYPKPRRTKVSHDTMHQPRRAKDKQKFQLRLKNSAANNNNKPPIIDAYLQKNQNSKNNSNNSEWKPKRRKTHRNKFVKHLTKHETDIILGNTKEFANPVLYTGEISVSRFNPGLSYVRVDGLDRDIRLSGFIDRNRAFHGDTVVVSLYPEIEWMAAIKPEIQQFADRLDERDREKVLEQKETDTIQEMGIEEEEVIMEVFNAQSSSSNSSNASESENGGSDTIKESDIAADPIEDEAEIIFFDDSDSENVTNTNVSKAKEESKSKLEIGQSIRRTRNGKRKFEELIDRKSVTAYDRYLFLRDMCADFEKFKQKWPDLDLMHETHPRRQYIDKVIGKCDGVLPSQALLSFEWPNPNALSDKIARGKVFGIYAKKKSAKEMIPGFILPILYNEHGEIDRKWAEFTPSDKRFPKARFPMREMPHKIMDLFNRFESEEIEIVMEFENRKHDLVRQGYKYKEAQKKIKKRANEFMDELRLRSFNMSFEDKWAVHNFMPICHLKQVLGRRGCIETETNEILSRHNISWRQNFEPKIESFVSENCKIDPKTDYTNRRDCRQMRVFTIDPTSARDFDDALSIEELQNEFDENGKKLYLIGIHIADVTHFVAEGSIVDKEAQRRATSVYLVDRCLPMLPHHLCQNLCSLNPNVDRLAYSVFVILNEEGHLIHRSGSDGTEKYAQSPWFGRTVIKSRARLNYETAHWILTDEIGEKGLDECCFISEQTSLSEICTDVKLFWSIARQMRERRFSNGSVHFFRPHIRFRLSKDKSEPLLFGPEISLFSNNLIEEMMLLANQLVANQLIQKCKSHTLLRKHPSPGQKEKGVKLQLLCRSHGIDLKCDTSKELNESLQNMMDYKFGQNMNDNTYVNASQIFNILLTQTMSRAEYIIVDETEATEWTHWALNFPIYTHFTSPIRRYADVMVHRLLTYTISSDSEELPLISINEMKKRVENCNTRNSNAHYAELESQQTHLCLLLIEKPIIVDAIVIDILNSMFICVVPGLGIEVRVNHRSVIEESKGKIVEIEKEFELPDSQLCIKWSDESTEIYKLFDKITIKLYSKLKIPIRLCTKIIEPYSRKFVKVANAAAFHTHSLNSDSSATNNAEEELVDTETETQNNNDSDIQITQASVAMTLEKQLKVGTSDFFDAHYD